MWEKFEERMGKHVNEKRSNIREHESEILGIAGGMKNADEIRW